MVILRYRGAPNVNDYIRARYGIRSRRDPASVFVLKVAEPLKDALGVDVPILVAEKWGEVNALATRKFILVSPQALASLSVDGLAALLCHELIHIKKGHVFSRKPKDPKTEDVIGQIGKKVRQIGRRRVQEYEADLSPMTLLTETGYNPRGVYELQKAIAREENERDLRPDLAHGSAVFRMLATQYIFRNRMVRNLSSGISEVPAALQTGYPADEFMVLTERKNGGFRYGMQERAEAAKTCHPLIAAEVLAHLPNDELSGILIERAGMLFAGLQKKDAELLAALYSKLFVQNPADELPACLKSVARENLGRLARLAGQIPEGMPVQNDGFILFRSIMNELMSTADPCFRTETCKPALGLIDALSKTCKSDLRKHQNVRSLLARAVVRAAKSEDKTLDEAVKLVPIMPDDTELLEYELGKLYDAKKLSLGKKPNPKPEEYKPNLETLEETECEFVSELLSLEAKIKMEEWQQLEGALLRLLRAYKIKSFEEFRERLDKIETASKVPVKANLRKMINEYTAEIWSPVLMSMFQKSYPSKWAFLKAALSFDTLLGEAMQRQIMRGKKYKWQEWSEFAKIVGEEFVDEESVGAFFHGFSEAERSDYFRMLKSIPGFKDMDVGPRRARDMTGFFDDFVSSHLDAVYCLDNPEHLDQLLTLSWFIGTRGVRIRAVNIILERLLPTMQPKEAIDFLLTDHRCEDLPLEAMEDYIEKHVRNPEDLEYTLKALDEKRKSIDDSKIGAASLVEHGIESAKLDPFEILKMMITDKSDEELCRLLETLNPDEDSTILREYNSLLNSPTADRYILLTYLLMGTFGNKKGVLLSEESRKELWNWYFSEYVKAADQKIYRLVKKKGEEFVAKAEPEDLFFAILPLLYERLLVQPRHSEVEELEERAYKGEVARDMLKKLKKIAPWPDEQHAEKLTEDEVIRKIASKMGAPGVRFLQSLGLVAEIPQKMRSAFEGTYDSMKGQMKLTAYDTIRQEGNGLEKRVTLGRPIGGGSLMTVYEGTLDGERVAIHVANPNALFFTDTTIRAMDAMLEDPDFAVARPLLGNVRTWVENDIGFNINNHLAFARLQAGWEFDGVRVRLPKLYYHSGNVVIDEYIEGHNLTQMENVRKIADPRKVARALVHNVLHQLQSGYIHPDIHPGNIRIDKEGRLVWLDSLFILELDARDRLFAAGMLSPDAAGTIVDYIGGSSPHEQEPIKAILESKGNLPEKLVKVSIELQRQGASLPLKAVLLLKDFLAVDSLVKRLGMARIEDAF